MFIIIKSKLKVTLQLINLHILEHVNTKNVYLNICLTLLLGLRYCCNLYH